MTRLLELAYRRLGRRYVVLAIPAVMSVTFLVALGGVALLWIYANLSAAEFGRIVAVVEAVVLVDVLLSLRVASKRLAPARPWLRGERTPETALAAWRTLLRLPLNLVRGPIAAMALVDITVVALYIVWELDEPLLPALLGVMAGAAVVVLYGAFLRFFALELVLRPVLADVSRQVPDRGFEGEREVSLKWRLLIALPAANIITGVIVAGLAAPGDDLAKVGLGVGFAIAVSFTVAFELTLLLLRVILGPLRDLRRGTERVAHGDFDVRIPVVGTDETGQLARSFNEMVVGLQERDRLRDAFGTFVDPSLAERVLEEGAVLAGEEVEVTVLFLDIRDFTAYAERTAARDVVARLNDFYERVVPVLVRHGGHANNFVGDGLLAVFGAPERLPGHADRAVDAAIEIARLVDEVYRGDLRIGIGVNSGPVLAGTIGGGGRLEFTVIGDAVNTASRVEHLTRETGDTVLVTMATVRLLQHDHGGFAERAAVELRGKREPVRLFAPAVPTAPARGTAVIAPGATAP
jgi:class 3 adenylate cyclase